MNEKEKTEFNLLLKSNTLVNRRLLAILAKKQKKLEDNEAKEEQFENPNWPYKQAYLNGKRSTIKEITDLFRFLET